MPRTVEIIDMVPECLQDEKGLKRLDAIFDTVAANSRWSNEDVAYAVCRLLRLICATKPRGE